MVVNVAAKDKSGKPIEGLKASDFTIAEDGKAQKIAVFEFQRLEEPLAVPAERALIPRGAAGAPAATPAAKKAASVQIAPSKPGEIRYRDRRLLVMFFDMTSMPTADQLRAQKAAPKFLDSQMTPSDLMAIMTFTSDLKVLQDFTDDRDALIKTIRKGLNNGEGATGRNGPLPGRNASRHGRRLHGRRYRVQYLQHRSQAGRHRNSGPHAHFSAGKEGADLFRQRHDQNRRRQRSADARHGERGHSRQHVALPHRRPRPGGASAPGRRH